MGLNQVCLSLTSSGSLLFILTDTWPDMPLYQTLLTDRVRNAYEDFEIYLLASSGPIFSLGEEGVETFKNDDLIFNLYHHSTLDRILERVREGRSLKSFLGVEKFVEEVRICLYIECLRRTSSAMCFLRILCARIRPISQMFRLMPLGSSAWRHWTSQKDVKSFNERIVQRLVHLPRTRLTSIDCETRQPRCLTSFAWRMSLRHSHGKCLTPNTRITKKKCRRSIRSSSCILDHDLRFSNQTHHPSRLIALANDAWSPLFSFCESWLIILTNLLATVVFPEPGIPEIPTRYLLFRFDILSDNQFGFERLGFDMISVNEEDQGKSKVGKFDRRVEGNRLTLHLLEIEHLQGW